MGAIDVVSDFFAFTPSSRDRSMVNIVVLALSYGRKGLSGDRCERDPELTSYPTTLAEVLGTTKNSVSRGDSISRESGSQYLEEWADEPSETPSE